jgi:hypothetical protein
MNATAQDSCLSFTAFLAHFSGGHMFKSNLIEKHPLAAFTAAVVLAFTTLGLTLLLDEAAPAADTLVQTTLPDLLSEE